MQVHIQLAAVLLLSVLLGARTQCVDDDDYWNRFRFNVNGTLVLCRELTTEPECTSDIVNMEGEAPRCRWWSGACVMAAHDVEFSVRADEPRYGQLPHRLTKYGNPVYDPFDATQDPSVGFKVISGPTDGQLIPVWSSTDLLSPDPAKIQLDGSFAYLYISQIGDTYPIDTEITYKYSNICGFAKFYGYIRIHVHSPESIARMNEKYQCHVTTYCVPENPDGSERPWVTQHVLPRIWSHIKAYTADVPAIPCFDRPEENAKFWFDNNSLVIEATARQGWGGQRIFSFGPMKGPTNLLHNYHAIEPTVSFDRQCAADVATEAKVNFVREEKGVWGRVFAPVTTNRDRTNWGDKYCELFNHDHLCANAPLLTVTRGKIPNVDGSDSVYDQPWITWAGDKCSRGVRGVFPWDLLRTYNKNATVSSIFLNKNYVGDDVNLMPVFRFTFPNPDFRSNVNLAQSNIEIKFDFYNSAIQPFSEIDFNRSFIDINNRYLVTLNVRQCLKFAFETGQDVFTVDFQWFRYKSTCPPLSPDPFKPWGLGVNLIIYPEAYNAEYPPWAPLIEYYHGRPVQVTNQAPKKIVGVKIYSTVDTTDMIGLPHNGNGDQLWWEDTCGYNDENNVNKIKPCTPEDTAAADPEKSCTWQNVTLRYKRHNPDDIGAVSNFWNEEAVLIFTLKNGETPTFKFRPGFVETALSINGAFTGCSGVCRTVPWDLEALRSAGISNAAGYQWESFQNCEQNGPASGDGWQDRCGWDARSGAVPGCMVLQTHDSVTPPTKCVPAISVTCEEPDAITYGPTDRVIFVYDIYNVGQEYVEPVSIRIEWSSNSEYPGNPSLAEEKVWVYHEQGKTAALASVTGTKWINPSFSFLNVSILTEVERNLPRLHSTAAGQRYWDFGFQFSPGLLNENMKIRIYTTLRVLTEPKTYMAPYRQPVTKVSKRRFIEEGVSDPSVNKLDCYVPEEASSPKRRMVSLASKSKERGKVNVSEEINYDPYFTNSRSAGAGAKAPQNIRKRVSTVHELHTAQSSDSESSQYNLSLTALAGVVIGAVIALLIIGGVALFLTVRRGGFQKVVEHTSSFSDAVTRNE